MSGAFQKQNRRRATVLVMVVGVLAMLFIIGSTLLVVSRFERQTVDQKVAAAQRGSGMDALLESILAQLRLEVVGLDGTPYNKGWSASGIALTGDTFEGEKFATLPGYIPDPDPSKDDSQLTPAELVQRRQNPLRGGNLLLASNELSNANTWFATSWLRLFVPSSAPTAATPLNYSIPLESNWGKPNNDADGDGVPDAKDSVGSDLTQYLRVVSHGGMVLLDWTTHPALLAQVIHPIDLPGAVTSAPNQGWALQQYIYQNVVINPATDEARLRRRNELPDNLDATRLADLQTSNPKDLRSVLPFTLGFKSADATWASFTPHWQQVRYDPTTTPPNDVGWWRAKMGRSSAFPPLARTEAGYDSGSDVYGRRHLLTTVSSDDILRPQRDENRLASVHNSGSPNDTLNERILPSSDALNYYLDYGTLPIPTLPFSLLNANWALQFNTPAARTQFSLRDALSDWPLNVAGTDYLRDPQNNPLPAGIVSYRRLVQLTAYYLAMLQHTNLPASNKDVSSLLAADLTKQLQAAAQLAVNTFDFADAGVPVVPSGTPPTDDLPTRFQWSGKDTASNDILIDVVGVERHPYITEAYAKIVQRPKSATPAEWNPVPDDPADGPPESIYAVELYNPYDVPLDLDFYSFATQVGNGAEVPLTVNLSGAWIQPHSYIVIANQANDPNYADYSSSPPTVAPKNPFIPTIGSTDVAAAGAIPATGASLITAGAAFTIPQGASIILKRKDALEVSSAGINYNPSLNVIVDILSPAGVPADKSTWLGANPSTWARPRLLAPTPSAAPTSGNQNAPIGACPTVTADTDPSGDSGLYQDIRPPGQDFFGNILPTGARLIRDYSLQRRKDAPGAPPKYWHETLSRQILLPVYPRYDYLSTGCTQAELVAKGEPDDQTCREHHNLLGTNYDLTNGWTGSQAVVASDFAGLQYTLPFQGNPNLEVFPLKAAPIGGFPVVLANALPETPHPHNANYTGIWNIQFQSPVSGVRVILDSRMPLPIPSLKISAVQIDGTTVSATVLNTTEVDAGSSTGPSIIKGIYVEYGISPAVGIAQGFRINQILDARTNQPVTPAVFPTTGTLALVSRYANLCVTPNPPNPPVYVPITVAATQVPPGVSRTAIDQLQQLDNGHMPLWDEKQTCTDNRDFAAQPPAASDVPLSTTTPQGAFDLPWGQLIYNYFTTLPLEELYHYRDLSLVPFNFTPTAQYQSIRLVDLDPQHYDTAYSILFPNTPVVEPVRTSGGALAGPKVRGRININTAPWWVLDGLPMLPWSSLPAVELIPVTGTYYDAMDGMLSGAFNHTQLPGLWFVAGMSDEDPFAIGQLHGFDGAKWKARSPLDLPSVSPMLARAMVAYREKRASFDGVTLANPTTQPGFLSVGQVADAMARVSFTLVGQGSIPAPAPGSITGAPGIREHSPSVSGAMIRPYAYLNYLHLVQPLVRLEDWATVKDHVFTIYVTQGDTTADPPVWTHTEVTVDRTRCLYGNDLPAKVAQIPPISYYNVVNDQ